MIVDDLTRDDVLYVLEHVQATCALRVGCDGCSYYIGCIGCALAHLPVRWELDQIGGDADDPGE